MVKREQADSGLRAGFIREEDAAKQLAERQAQSSVLEENLPAEASSMPASVPLPENHESSQAAKGPKIEMDKGVSGKVITGVMKVVRKKAKKDSVEKPSETAASNEAAPLEKEQPSQPSEEKPAASVAKAPAARPAESGRVGQKEGVSAETAASAEVKVSPEPRTAPEAVKSKGEVAKEAQQVEAPHKEAPIENKVDERPAEKAAPAPVEDKSKQKAEEVMTTSQVPEAAKSNDKKEDRIREAKVTSSEATRKAEIRKDAAAPAPVRTEAARTKPATAEAPHKAQATTRAPEEKKALTPESPAPQKAETHSEKTPSGVKVDQGVILSAAERLAQKGKTIIRPQKGNYLGSDKDTPAFREPRAYSSDRGYRRNSREPLNRERSGNFNRERPGNQGRGFSKGDYFNKDKDADESPRRSRSPKPAKPGQRFAPAPDMGEVKKNESRRAFAQRRDKHNENRSAHLGRPEIAFDEETLRRNRRRKNRREEQEAQQPAQRTQLTQVKLPATMSVKELAEMLKKTAAEVITKLMSYGVMATLNQEIDYDTAELVASEFGITAEKLLEVSEEEILFDDSEDAEEDLVSRPPVVVVMGHVDHGKTSILDWIRESRVAAGEAGGITQHIGAYMVDVNGRKLTFLDTPGHEAFTAMRARGAQVTDIAILVVAADDGVMPQTIEAIHHAKAAGTEIIVAINKIDKPGANLDRVKQELATQGLLAPDWGGDVTMVPVSAKTGENMDELLEMVLLTADVLELKANPKRQAKGTVIEARLDRTRGPIATVLVQRGTLYPGDTVVVGSQIGNIRAMSDEHRRPLKSAGPSVPVEILGLPEVPEDGDIFYVVENDRVARSLVERRQQEERERQLKRSTRVSLDNLFEKMSEGETKDLNIIIKADVQGSVEAITQSMEKLSNEEVKIHTVHGAVGAITESDVRLAEVSEAIIIGFNVRPAPNVSDMAKEMNVDIRLYRVIYEALEDMEKAMKGLLAPTFEEEILGHAEVRELYKASGIGTIAGCYVTDGKIVRTADLRLLRDGIIVHEGKLASLKRFKDDAREVAQGYECGLNIERFNDVKVGDVVEMYRIKEVSRD